MSVGAKWDPNPVQVHSGDRELATLIRSIDVEAGPEELNAKAQELWDRYRTFLDNNPGYSGISVYGDDFDRTLAQCQRHTRRGRYTPIPSYGQTDGRFFERVVAAAVVQKLLQVMEMSTTEGLRERVASKVPLPDEHSELFALYLANGPIEEGQEDFRDLLSELESDVIKWAANWVEQPQSVERKDLHFYWRREGTALGVALTCINLSLIWGMRTYVPGVTIR